MSQAMVDESPDRVPALVVAIETRDAGIDAVRKFFADHVSDRLHEAYVLFQDDSAGGGLDPDEVRAVTGLEVVSAAEGLRLEPGRVHLVDPRLRMAILEHCLVSVPRGETPTQAAGSGIRPNPTQASFREIAEATPAMMWSVAQDGTTWRNKAMRGYLGLTGDENPYWIGEATQRFIHPDDRSRLENAVRGVLSAGLPWEGEYRLRRADGDFRWVSVVINSLRLDDGSIHSVGVVEDIHDRRMLETSLREMNRELENRVAARTAELADRNERLRQRNEVLDQFAHAASHDLKAPLRTIRSYISLLEEELAAAGADELLPISDLTGRITASADRMQRLLEALLRYAMVGRRELFPHPVDPILAARTAVQHLDADIGLVGAQVEIGDLPQVLGDEDALAEVFTNVIANALRYRRDEPPRIQIVGDLQSTTVRIDVTDNGRGFEPRFAEAVFEPFRRLTGGEEAGSGLGLAICARIVERLGGRISATSQPGVGTTITLELRGVDE